jgi:hypothetical protein
MSERRTNEQETIEARIGLAAAFRMAARLDMHEGVCNHFSFMLPERRFLINPKGLHFSRITASSIILMDEDGNTLEGTGRPPKTGHSIHTRVHLRHPSAKVVLHLHAPIRPLSPRSKAAASRWFIKTPHASTAISPMTTISPESRSTSTKATAWPR